MNKFVFLTFGDYKIPCDGGSRFTSEVLNAFINISSRESVRVLSFYDLARVKSPFLRKVASIPKSLIFKLPIPVAYFFSFRFKSVLLKVIKELLDGSPSGTTITLVIDHLELAYLSSIVRDVFGGRVRIFHISHNAEPVLFEQRFGGSFLYGLSECICPYVQYEKDVVVEMNSIISISSDEISRFEAISKDACSCCSFISIPPIFNYKHKSVVSEREQKRKLVFLANFNWWPNLKAFNWIKERLAPILPSNYEIYIYGKNSLKYSSGSPSNMIFKGFVDNIEEVWENAFFSLAPIDYGAGVNVKVAESLHNGVPVIGTSKAFEGIQHKQIGGAIFLKMNEQDWLGTLEYFDNNFNDYIKKKHLIKYPTKKETYEKLNDFMQNE